MPEYASSSGKSSQSSQSKSSSYVTLTKSQQNSAIAYNKKYNQSIAKSIQKLVGTTQDGIFGPNTVNAIARWQANNGLSADGQFGPKSKAKANLDGSSSSNTTSSNTSSSSSKKRLTSAQETAAIRYNKQYNQSICTKIQGIVGTTQDGSFGPNTVNAIADWQASKGLTVDGQFGPASKQAAGISSSEGGTPGNVSGRRTINYRQGGSTSWAQKVYGGKGYSTYAEAGCGPSAIANVVHKLKDGSVTPYTVGTKIWELNRGWRPYNNGTAHAAIPGMCSHYGISCRNVSASTGVKELQSSNKIAIAVMGAGTWTSGGHYITPYACDGTYIYADTSSSRNRDNGKQKVSGFKNEAKNMWIIG